MTSGKWKRHDGSGMPVPAGTYVTIMRRNGQTCRIKAGYHVGYVDGTGDEETVVPSSTLPLDDMWVWPVKGRHRKAAAFEIVRYRVEPAKGMEILRQAVAGLSTVS